MDSIRSCLDYTLLRPDCRECWPCSAGMGAFFGGVGGLFAGLGVEIATLTTGEAVVCGIVVGAAGGAVVGTATAATFLAFCCKGQGDTESHHNTSINSRMVTRQPDTIIRFPRPDSDSDSDSPHVTYTGAYYPAVLMDSHGGYCDSSYGGGDFGCGGGGGGGDGGGGGGCGGE